MKNAKLYGQDGKWDIEIKEEKFHSVKPAANTEHATEDHTIDLNGKLVLPPYVEPHIHLDYVLTAVTTMDIPFFAQ